MSYWDYLVYEAASTASALTDAVATALQMQDEGFAISYLERKLRVNGLKLHPNPETVEARPKGADS